MKGVKYGHTAKTNQSFKKKLWGSITAILLVFIAWLIWQLFAYNNAVRMAKHAGFYWYSEDPISLIRKDWRNALKMDTWGSHQRELQILEVSDLDDYREMLQRLRPNLLEFKGCIKLQNVNALKDLNNLLFLSLSGCTELQNVDGLKNLPALEILFLNDCSDLRNIDGLKNIATLTYIELIGCNELQNVDSLKELSNIKWIYLQGCTELKNVDGLKNLTTLRHLNLCDCAELQTIDGLKGLNALEYLYLQGCHKIPAAALRELHAALPKTNIVFPDGTTSPPP